MDRILSLLRKAGVGAIAMLAAGGAASCTDYYASGYTPNPTVVYNYRSDQELLNVSRQAAAYCAQFGANAHYSSVTTEPDGNNRAVFECVGARTAYAQPVTPPLPPVAVPPSKVYSYRTDQELLQAQRSALEFCMSQGYRSATGTITGGGYGAKTATFQCSTI